VGGGREKGRDGGQCELEGDSGRAESLENEAGYLWVGRRIAGSEEIRRSGKGGKRTKPKKIRKEECEGTGKERG